MKHLKKIFANIAWRMGYNLTPNWRVHRLALAQHLKQIFNLLNIDCIFDVGANSGQYRNFLRDEVDYDGLIISFEPLPALAEILIKNSRKDPLWVVYNHALGADNGMSDFNVMQDSQFSSFLEPDNSRVKSFKNKNIILNRVSVRVKSLCSIYDKLWHEYGFKHPYLKMDTQGFDLEVIKGGLKVLSNFPALQTEASVRPIYEAMPDYRTVIKEIEKLGYCLSGIFPVNPVGALHLVEFECVMVSSDNRVE